jgi:hypothetical protein
LELAVAEENIPKEIAMSICDKIRKENKKLGFARIQCWVAWNMPRVTLVKGVSIISLDIGVAV